MSHSVAPCLPNLATCECFSDLPALPSSSNACQIYLLEALHAHGSRLTLTSVFLFNIISEKIQSTLSLTLVGPSLLSAFECGTSPWLQG